MNNLLIRDEIKEINKRFINICLRAEESTIIELSTQINCSMSIIRMLRNLSFDQIETLVKADIFILQPCIEEKSLFKAIQIHSNKNRKLFLHTTVNVKNAVI